MITLLVEFVIGLLCGVVFVTLTVMILVGFVRMRRAHAAMNRRTDDEDRQIMLACKLTLCLLMPVFVFGCMFFVYAACLDGAEQLPCVPVERTQCSSADTRERFERDTITTFFLHLTYVSVHVVTTCNFYIYVAFNLTYRRATLATFQRLIRRSQIAAA